MSRPMVIEIVGPAGAGKSTIAATLARRRPDAVVVAPPDPRSWSNLPFYARNVLASLPVLARMGLPRAADGRLSRKPVASVVVLRGWSGRLAREKQEKRGLILLDQGPVYLLAGFCGRCPRGLLQQSHWWDATYARWARVLDCVVWLDADDSVLMPRIREREKAHRVKGVAEEEGRRHLSRWRRSLGYILAHLTARSPGLRILRYDTSSCSPELLADLLLAELGAP